MTKPGDARENLVSRLGPDERDGLLVGDVNVPPDGGFELPGAAMHAAAELLLRERGLG